MIDEMFRDRIVYWTRMLDLFTCTMGTLVALARVRVGSPIVLAGTYRDNKAATRPTITPQRDQAYAHLQISKLNR